MIVYRTALVCPHCGTGNRLDFVPTVGRILADDDCQNYLHGDLVHGCGYRQVTTIDKSSLLNSKGQHPTE